MSELGVGSQEWEQAWERRATASHLELAASGVRIASAPRYLKALRGLSAPGQVKLFAGLPALMEVGGWLDVTQREIARAVGLDQGTVSRGLKALEAKKVLARVDGRRRFSPRLVEKR